jgi:ParB/RepB/Spo0J family partition protein
MSTATAPKTRNKRAGEIVLLSPSDLFFEEGFNFRQNYTGIEELAKSINSKGQVNPIQVYKIRSGENKGKYYVRIGHRRTLAAQMIAKTNPDFEIKALCLAKNDPLENLLLQFNSQTEVPLNPIEKGNLINALLENDMDAKEIQANLGISQAQFYNLIKLTAAPASVQEAVTNDLISGTTVNALIRTHSNGTGNKRTLDGDALAVAVEAAISDAQAKPTKGKKGAKATGSNTVGKKVSLEAKIKQLIWLSQKSEENSEAIEAFVAVITSLEDADSTAESVFDALAV